MKIKTLGLAVTILFTGASAEAGLLSSIKGLFHDCKGHCEKGNIKCDSTDVNKKGSVAYCQKTCLGDNKKDADIAKYQEGIASCGVSSSSEEVPVTTGD